MALRALLAVLGLALALPAQAPAAPGALKPQGCIADVPDIGSCGAAQQGLGGAGGVAVSPDNKSVYVVSRNDDAIVRFDRNTTTGALTPQGCIADVGDLAGCGATQQGLDGAFDVAVSPDGKSVYVASSGDDAIVRFDRNTTNGALIPQGCIADAGNAAGCAATQQGLNRAFDVAVSPDGSSVYVPGIDDDAIVRFDRNADGVLTAQGCIADIGDVAGCLVDEQGLDGASAVAVSGDNKSVYVTSSTDHALVRFDRTTPSGALGWQGCFADPLDVAGCGAMQQGLFGANAVVVSPDSTSVYVASRQDGAIALFDRALDTTVLTPQGCIADAGDSAGCGGATQQGLADVHGIATSADGESVYTISQGENTIARFDRSPTTGALTPGGCIADLGDFAGCGTEQQGLASAQDVAVSPDGKSVYVASLSDSAIVRFDRGDFEVQPPPPPPPPPPPGGPPEECTNATTLLVTCLDAGGAPGICVPGQLFLPQCQGSTALPVTCGPFDGSLACQSPGPAVTGCGSLGIALPGCPTPNRPLPNLCTSHLGSSGMPVCTKPPESATVCPPPAAGNSTPTCNVPINLGGPVRPAARATPRAGKLAVTIGCRKALATQPKKRCAGWVALDALRQVLTNTLKNQAVFTASQYRVLVQGGEPLANPFQTTANTLAKNALGRKGTPPVVDLAAAVAAFGRSDSLTRAYAASLGTAVSEYRAIARQRRPPGGSPVTPVAAAKRTATIKKLRIKSGKREKIVLRLPKAAMRRLARDANKRGRVPVRLLVLFKAEPLPVARFIDLAVRVPRKSKKKR